MKKIVILTEHYFEYLTGGAEYQISFLAQELLRIGYDVHYIFISYGTDQPTSMDINLHPIKAKSLSRKFGHNNFLYKSDICKVLNKIKPDFIYQRSTAALCGIAAKYTRNNDCKLIWHIASQFNVQPFHLNSVKTVVFDYLDKKYIEYGLRNADYIVGQAKYQNDLLFENYNRKCDLIAGNWHPMPKQPCSKTLPIKVVWIANIRPHKQPDIFVDLAERLQNIDNVEFIMVGRPTPREYQKQLEKKIDKLDNLKYLRERPNDEVNELLSKSHIFVSTSKNEGFSNTFIQAWMREVPVVSLIIDPDDIIKRESIGFHSNNFENLVRDTKKLIENPSLLAQMGKRARIFANKNHSLIEMNKVINFFK